MPRYNITLPQEVQEFLKNQNGGVSAAILEAVEAYYGDKLPNYTRRKRGGQLGNKNAARMYISYDFPNNDFSSVPPDMLQRWNDTAHALTLPYTYDPETHMSLREEVEAWFKGH